MINQILDAVIGAITAIPEFNGTVYKFRTYPFGDLPAANVAYGNMAHQELSGSLMTSAVEIIVEIKEKVTTGSDLAPNLLSLHSKVFTALMSDPTLGLPFVIDLAPQQSSKPEVSEDTEEPSISFVMVFECSFRHQRTSLT